MYTEKQSNAVKGAFEDKFTIPPAKPFLVKELNGQIGKESTIQIRQQSVVLLLIRGRSHPQLPGQHRTEHVETVPVLKLTQNCACISRHQ